MFDNLRRSLVAPLSLALLLLALSGHGLSPWAALALVLAAFSAGPLLGAVAGFAPSRDDIALRHFYRQAAFDLLRALCGALCQLAQLLQQAALSLDAIGARAVAACSSAGATCCSGPRRPLRRRPARSDLAGVLRRHRPSRCAPRCWSAGLWAVGTPHPALAVALCLLWAASPLWTWFVSRPLAAGGDAALPLPDQAYLHDVARDTWRFFERCVVAEEHHLPPDNLQTDAARHASRTAPRRPTSACTC